MRRALVASLGCLTLITLGLSLTHCKDDPNLVAPTEARSPEEERKGFRLPPGFEIQLVAAEPDIRKPMNLAFDDRGRLWVTESMEYPYPAPGDRKGRDSVKILEDTDGDGRADKITTFADGLNIPIGLLPITNGAIVYSIPNVYRMIDHDGDDRADAREVLYGSFGYVDTHGMCSSLTWGLDGWIYATHGFANTSNLKARDGSSITMHSGNTFRMKPDGSRIEQWTWGQVNPFGMCFDLLGNLYTADCHSRPIMMLLRGGYYQSFGKPHDGLGFAPEMCPSDHGSTGIAGIVYYEGGPFPPEYKDTIFLGNPVTNRINHDRTERVGSTVKAIQQQDFLTSDDPWFRPVNIALGPDGALYVADFYNCIIGHYEVPLTHPRRDRERGRIWRIVYKGGGSHTCKPPVADFARASAPELIELLGHVNPSVRLKATNQLVSRGQGVRSSMQDALRSPSPFTRQHALWVLERLGGVDIGQLTRSAGDSEPQVRIAAVRILAERKTLEPSQDALLVRSLEDADPTVLRNAAEALGQHPSAAHLQPLLAAWRSTPPEDTQLVHALRIALRNQLLPAETWTALRSIPLTEDDVQKIADVSLGVRSSQAADFLMTHLGAKALERMNRARNVHHIARHGTPETVKTLLAFVQSDRPDDLGHQSSLLRGFLDGTQERGQRLGGEARPWAESVITRLLDASDARQLQAGLELAIALKPAGAMPRLREIALDSKQDENRRVAAFNALVALDAQAQLAALGEALANASEPITLREKVVGVLAGINSPAGRAELLKNLPTSPARLQTVLAVGLAGNREGAEALLDAIAAGKASARLLQERVVEARLRASQPPKLEERLALLTRGLPPVDERLQQMLNQRRSGFLSANANPEKGVKVFEQHCAACHQLQNKGAKVGPQLDGIGVRGLDRLLEDLVDPNRNVDQAFRASLLLRTDGQLVQGLVLREEGAVLVLADDKGKEVRISSAEIAERKVSTLSPMPANLLDQVPEKDFYDLVAYLLSQRARPPQPSQGSSGP